MAAFVVMQPPSRDGADAPPVLVHDGFSFAAFLVPPLWLLWHRLWVEAALAFLLALAIGALGAWLGPANGFLSLLVSIYIGVENGALRANAFSRRGYAEKAVVEADTSEEAEIRYFMAEDTVAPTTQVVSSPTVTFAPSQRSPAHPSALGLLSYPGRG